MNGTLEQLLRQADASSPLPATMSGLARRVIEMRTRQTRRRRVIAGVGTIMLLLAVVVEWMQSNRSPAPVAKVIPPIDWAAKIASAELQASIHERTAALMLASRTANRSTPPLSTPDMRMERDRAALVLVYEADQHARESRPAAAIACYRRTVELFPQSHWADVARQRLKEMPT